MTGDVIEAFQQFSDLAPETERVPGAEHPETFAARTGLAATTDVAGDKAGARRQLAALLPLAKGVLGSRDQITHAVRGIIFRLDQELGR